MEAHYIGFKMWAAAVEKAGTTDPDAVQEAIIGVSVPNLTGGIATMMPNHHITKPVFIGEIQDDGQFEVVWQTAEHRRRRRVVRLPAGLARHHGGLDAAARLRQLQRQDRHVLRSELRVTAAGPPSPARTRGPDLLAPFAARSSRVTKLATAPSPLSVRGSCSWRSRRRPPRRTFHRGVAALGERRVVRRQGSRRRRDHRRAAHARAEAVLTALLEGELYTTRAGGRLVMAADADAGYAIRDAVTDEDLGTVGRRDVSRVTVNNQLRGTLRSMMASAEASGTRTPTSAAPRSARSANPKTSPCSRRSSSCSPPRSTAACARRSRWRSPR